MGARRRPARRAENRFLESSLVEGLNGAAHPHANWTAPPTDSTRQVRDLAEIANRLWGHRTPGGRLYPSPVRREAAALAWSPDGASRSIGHASWLEAPEPDAPGWSCVVLMACPGRPGGAEWDGLDWDEHHERTRYPTRLLWGPGTVAEAAGWWAARESPPGPDTVRSWDRRLAVADGGRVVDLDGLATGERPAPPDTSGTWCVVLADNPFDAMAHGRHTSAAAGDAARTGPCEVCHCDEITRGAWAEIVGLPAT